MALDTSRIACLVPARSGSTRITDKNLQAVGGLTLLERAIAIGLEAFGHVTVSTDSERYASVAKEAGAHVPGLRPHEVALSDTPMDAVIRHALHAWFDGPEDILVLAQPTSPFSTADDLRATAAALIRNPRAACALTAREIPSTSAYALARQPDGLSRFLAPHMLAVRTQDLPVLAVPTGAAYAAPVGRLRDGEPLVAEPVVTVIVDADHALDVDEPDDLELARKMAGS